MLLLLATTAAWATAAPPHGVTTIVDRACQPTRQLAAGAPLELTHHLAARTCPEPCTPLVDAPIPAADLELWVDGCDAPLDGRFVATARTCEGHPVWRWDGPLPAGHRYTVRTYPPSGDLTVAVGGPPAAPSCPPPARVPVTRPYAPEPAAEQTTTLWIPLDTLSVDALPDGRWRLSWDLRAAGGDRFYAGASALSTELDPTGPLATALSGLTLDEDRARVRARAVTTDERLLTGYLSRGRAEECDVERVSRVRVHIDGLDATLEPPPGREVIRTFRRCPDVPDAAWLAGPPRPTAP